MPLPKCKDLHNALTRSKKLRVAIGCYSISFCQKKKQKYLLKSLLPRIPISYCTLGYQPTLYLLLSPH